MRFVRDGLLEVLLKAQLMISKNKRVRGNMVSVKTLALELALRIMQHLSRKTLGPGCQPLIDDPQAVPVSQCISGTPRNLLEVAAMRCYE